MLSFEFLSSSWFSQRRRIFWRGGGASIDDSAIGEVQKLLDENRSILIDYMKLSFRKGEDEDKPDERLDTLARTRTRNRQRVLGTGATAKVVAAVYVLYCSSFHRLLITHRLEYYKHRYKPSRRDTEIRKDLGKKRIGVAVKVFTPESITAQLLHVFAKEIELMRKLKHPHARYMPRTQRDASSNLCSVTVLCWWYIEIVTAKATYTLQESRR